METYQWWLIGIGVYLTGLGPFGVVWPIGLVWLVIVVLHTAGMDRRDRLKGRRKSPADKPEAF